MQNSTRWARASSHIGIEVFTQVLQTLGSWPVTFNHQSTMIVTLVLTTPAHQSGSWNSQTTYSSTVASDKKALGLNAILQGMVPCCRSGCWPKLTLSYSELEMCQFVMLWLHSASRRKHATHVTHAIHSALPCQAMRGSSSPPLCPVLCSLLWCWALTLAENHAHVSAA